MKPSTRRGTGRAEWAGVVVAAAILLGALVRFNPPLLAGFPVGDGGMFAVMVDDLRQSRYSLPEFTSYNHRQIPFAYPPLGFYAGRVAADLFGWASGEALRWVPAFFASLAVPAFYLLAIRLLRDRYRAAVATLFFALMPRALSWFVLGGGLTRSPGQLFMLLTLASLVHQFRENRRRDVVLTGLFAGLTVLSHPEAAVHMIASVLLFWLVLARSRAGFVTLAGAGVIAAAVSAPWWWTVIRFHGLDPLLSAVQTGQKGLAVLNLVSFDFAEEPFATLIAVLGLLGLAHCLVRRDLLLPLWLAVPFLVEGRSAVLPAAIPLAMLASLGFADVVLPALLSRVGGAPKIETEVTGVEFGLFVYVVLFLLFSTYQFGLQLAGTTLPRQDRAAMDWVRQNTAPEGRFLVLTGTNSITCDWVLEWFPALTGRQSLYTVQGMEWVEGGNFVPYVRAAYEPQRCLTDGDLSCLDAVVDRSGYDYLYITRSLHRDCRTLPLENAFHFFLESVRLDGQFRVIFESERAILFVRE